MTDLISRAYVLAEYDRQHQGPPGGARKIMAEAPAVDAVPVEWLTDLIDRTAYADRNGDYKMWALHGAAYAVLKEWQKEQEAMKNGH